jgi:hypothetical protein
LIDCSFIQLPNDGLALAYIGVRFEHATIYSMLSSDSATLL